MCNYTRVYYTSENFSSKKRWRRITYTSYPSAFPSTRLFHWSLLPCLVKETELHDLLIETEFPTAYPFSSVQFSSATQSCPTLCDPMKCSMPDLHVHYQLPELALTHVHWVGDAIQPSHPLSSPSPPAFNLSQQRGLIWWISSSHQVAKVLEFQLQHQSFQWIFRIVIL